MLVPTAEQIKLATIADVTISGVANTEVLAYNSTSGNWENTAAASGAISNVVEDTSPQLGGNLDTQGNDLTGLGLLDFAAPTELTIATGAITVTQSFHTVDTESDAASDDLDTVTAAGTSGEVVILKAENAARSVVLKHGTGNLNCVGNADITLDDAHDFALGIYDGTNWCVAPLTAAAGGGISNVVDDTTPQLGGALDVNGAAIVSASGGDIAITPDTTGDVILDGLKWPQADGTANYVIETDGAGQLSFVAQSGGSTWAADQNSAGFGIDDTNGNELLTFGTTASAVNELKITNAATGGDPVIEATGGDASVSMRVQAKGTTGYVEIWAGATPLKVVDFLTNASAVNNMRISNTVAGSYPAFTVEGSDTDIGYEFNTKNAGTFKVQAEIEITTATLFNATPQGSEPGTPNTDDIYLDDGTNTSSLALGFRYYDGASWNDIG
jgi:hypothetical protein